ncbi:aldose epimerase family protein [Nocardioides marinus]
MESRSWGRVGAQTVTQYVVENNVLRLEVLSTGAALHRLLVPGPTGPEDVVLGHRDAAAQARDEHFVGVVVGRYANRLRDGLLRLDGREHRLLRNEGPHTLHGGPDGFGRRQWSGRAPTGDEADDADDAVTLELVSPDGDQGFPGCLRAQVTYAVRGDEVEVALRATADATTVVNLTQHSYFDLGAGVGDLEDHRLRVPAVLRVAVDDELLPVDERPVPVVGTRWDLRHPRPLEERWDDCWVLGAPGIRRLAAVLEHPPTGRRLEVSTDAPGLQVYTGDALPGLPGKDGRPLVPRAGVALEAQDLPDAPGRPAFWPPVLRPGEVYARTTWWRFG